MIHRISPEKIIGALAYRTMSALNGNTAFKARLAAEYPYVANCLVDGEFHLWHYFGTHSEISKVITAIAQDMNGSYVKFPSFLNFMPVEQRISGYGHTISFNLAIAASTNSEWLSDQRFDIVFDTLLRPIYEAFMLQVISCGWFAFPAGMPVHSKFECPTTGSYSGTIISKYSEHIDVIELRGLQLPLKRLSMCEDEIVQIEADGMLVLDTMKDLLTLKN